MESSPTEPNNSSSVIYIEEEHRSEWSYDATKELLKIYDEKTDMLETGIITTQKKLWELTSKTLAKKGFFYTGAQCENKWKALKRAYRTKLDRIHKFGTYKRTCPFESEVAEILSKRPNDSITRSYSFKINAMRKEDDLFNKVNLNEPPGFAKGDNTLEQEEEDIKNITLLDNNLEDFPSEAGEYNQPAYTVIQQESDVGQNVLVEELADLKKVIMKQGRANAQLLKETTEVQEKILGCLEEAVHRQQESLEIEGRKVKQQDEIIKQMKIQNELLERLIDKFA